MTVGLVRRRALVISVALFLASVTARADQPAPAQATKPADKTADPAAAPVDALPGSPIPPGLGLSPEAPPVPPAPGGRAPSFGAPTAIRARRPFGSADGSSAGRPSGSARSRPIRRPATPARAIHAPLLTTGKIPFWGGAGATLNIQYGTKYLTAYVAYYFRTNNETFQGYANPQLGPGFGTAYLLITPDPIGTLRLQFRVGAFTEVYAGPGQWGWGIFGPMLALRGYGETANGEWDLNRRWRLTLTQGFLVVPGVPENFPRGDYNSWIETGVSSYVNHAHVGLVLDNQWTFRLHYATDHGTDERKYLHDLPRHAAPGRPDGHLYRRGALAGRPLGTVRGERRRSTTSSTPPRSATASGGASTGRRAPAR